MPIVTARSKVKGQLYEVQVDLDEALKVKTGSGDIFTALQTKNIFTDLKKGMKAGQSELENAFGTLDVHEIAKKIIISGEVQKTQDFRDAEKEKKAKQLISLIIKNAVDQNSRPYTEDRIKRALEEAKYNIDNKPAEQQVSEAIESLKKIIPIKMDLKKVRLTIPAQYTGQAYGLLKDFKQKEEWMSNGALVAILAIPAGMQIDFYEKLNNITHGSVQSEELAD